MINNDHHSLELIGVDLPPYRRIILWLLCVGKKAARPVLGGSSVSGFMNESEGERGVACLIGILLLPDARLHPSTRAGRHQPVERCIKVSSTWESAAFSLIAP